VAQIGRIADLDSFSWGQAPSARDGASQTMSDLNNPIVHFSISPSGLLRQSAVKLDILTKLYCAFPRNDNCNQLK